MEPAEGGRVMDAFQVFFDDLVSKYWDDLTPIEEWDADDLVALEIICNGELQRRAHDQSVLA